MIIKNDDDLTAVRSEYYEYWNIATKQCLEPAQRQRFNEISDAIAEYRKRSESYE